MKVFLQGLHGFQTSAYCLIQFWEPFRTAGKVYLTCLNQPFGPGPRLLKGLFSYRKICLEKEFIPVDDELDPPRSVFNLGQEWPELCRDTSYCLNKKYPPQHDGALTSYVSLPLLESIGNQPHCVGVLEIISNSSIMAYMTDLIEYLCCKLLVFLYMHSECSLELAFWSLPKILLCVFVFIWSRIMTNCDLSFVNRRCI